MSILPCELFSTMYCTVAFDVGNDSLLPIIKPKTDFADGNDDDGNDDDDDDDVKEEGKIAALSS
jgi:hypothetical protein